MPFDLPRGLQLFLPIADYHSFRSGRIEGRGVHPDVAVPADQAMDEALARTRRRWAQAGGAGAISSSPPAAVRTWPAGAAGPPD